MGKRKNKVDKCYFCRRTIKRYDLVLGEAVFVKGPFNGVSYPVILTHTKHEGVDKLERTSSLEGSKDD